MALLSAGAADDAALDDAAVVGAGAALDDATLDDEAELDGAALLDEAAGLDDATDDELDDTGALVGSAVGVAQAASALNTTTKIANNANFFMLLLL